ncbi:MAG: acyltransferase [Prevotella sp.]|nr:acyltransferase [Prevotella sp.]
MNKSSLLSRQECSAMRGVAILAIVLHNFCHWINTPIVKENEFRFRIDRVQEMLHAVCNPDIYLPVQLVSFFGHYGVPVFLFLSGWGLVMKYERANQPVPFLPFVRYNYLKLLRMMIVGFVAYLIVDRMTPGSRNYTLDIVIEHLLMVVNFVDNPDRTIHPGPYWFFGIMMQLYIAYILLFHRFRHWAVIVVAIVVCTIVQLPQEPDSLCLEWIRYNLFGSVLPFGAGILLARSNIADTISNINHNIALWAITLLVSVLLVFFMSLYYVSWYFVPIFVCIGAIAFVKLLPTCVMRYAVWVGVISSALFVSHPIARKLFIPVSRNNGEIYCGILLYIIVAIGIAWVVKMLTDKIPLPKQITEH